MNLPMTRADMVLEQYRIENKHPELPEDVKDFIFNLVMSVEEAYTFVFFFEKRECYQNLGKYLRACLEQDEEAKDLILKSIKEKEKVNG